MELLRADWQVQEIGELIRFLRAQKKPDLIVHRRRHLTMQATWEKYFQEIGRLAGFGICVVAGLWRCWVAAQLHTEPLPLFVPYSPVPVTLTSRGY